MGVVSLVTVLEKWLYRKNEQMELTDFFAGKYKFTKIKSRLKFFGWGWSEMGVASLVTGL